MWMHECVRLWGVRGARGVFAGRHAKRDTHTHPHTPEFYDLLPTLVHPAAPNDPLQLDLITEPGSLAFCFCAETCPLRTGD